MGSAAHIASRIRNYSSKLELMAPDLHICADSEKQGVDYARGVFLRADYEIRLEKGVQSVSWRPKR